MLVWELVSMDTAITICNISMKSTDLEVLQKKMEVITAKIFLLGVNKTRD